MEVIFQKVKDKPTVDTKCGRCKKRFYSEYTQVGQSIWVRIYCETCTFKKPIESLLSRAK